jgi:hypothetical protein
MAMLYIRPVLLGMHKNPFEYPGAFVGRHLCYGLVTVAESHFVKVLMMRLAINEHLYTPLRAVFCSYNPFNYGFEDYSL